MPSRRSIHILAHVTLLGVALGCQSMDLEVDDRDRFTPSGRISYEIWPGIDQRRSGTLLDLVTGSSGGDQGKAVTARSAGIKPTISIESPPSRAVTTSRCRRASRWSSMSRFPGRSG